MLRDIVRKYSDFVAYPVRLKGDTLNSMKAIWARPKEEVSEEQYREFYKHLTHDWNDPLEHVLVHVEGTVEARALLYVPSKAPFDLFMREGERRGVQLYVKRVFIMDDWEALLPPWLRFVRGVVASDDLSLNVSREILQKDRQIQAIRKHLARRLLGALKEMKEQRADEVPDVLAGVRRRAQGRAARVRGEPGPHPRAGAGASRRPRPPASSRRWPTTSARMKEGQEAIYYMTAATQSAAERSPHLEAFRAKGFEVLFFTDPVDELWLRLSREFWGKKLVSVAAAAATPEANDEEAKKEEEARKEQEEGLRGLLDTLRAKLQDHVKDVRLSSRLTESPACLVGDPGDISPHLRELLRRSGQEAPVAKRTLELNAVASDRGPPAGPARAPTRTIPSSRSTPTSCTARRCWPRARRCPIRRRSAGASPS